MEKLKEIDPNQYITKIWFTKWSKNYITPCPWCWKEKDKHFNFYQAKDWNYLFKCFTCWNSGDIVSLWMQKKWIESQEAIEELNKIILNKDFEKQEEKELDFNFLNEQCLQNGSNNQNLLLSLLKEKWINYHINWVGIYYFDTKNKDKWALSLAIKDTKWNIIWLQTRNNEWKRVIKTSKLWYFYDKIDKNERLYIVEWLTDYLSLKYVWINNVLWLVSSSQKTDDIKELIGNCSDIIICLDSDIKTAPEWENKPAPAGLLKSYYLKKLLPKAKVFFLSVEPNNKVDINDYLKKWYDKKDYERFFEIAKDFSENALKKLLNQNSDVDVEVYANANDIVESYNLAFLSGMWYQFDELKGIWVKKENIEIRTLIIDYFHNKWVEHSKSKINDVIFYAESIANKINWRELNKRLILNDDDEEERENRIKNIYFKNGIFNIKNLSFKQYKKEDYIINTLNVKYNEKHEKPVNFYKFLDWLFNEEKEEHIRLLQQWMWYILTIDNSRQKALILKWEWWNWKGTFTRIMETILWKNNITTFELSELSNEVNKAQLLWKMVNISSEIDQRATLNSPDFKKITWNDTLTWKSLYKDPITFRPFCKIVFSLNKLPVLTEANNAMARRLHIVTFDNTFKIDPNFEKKLYEEIDWIVAWAIEWLYDLIENDFIVPKKVFDYVNKYINSADYIGEFIYELEDKLLLDFNIDKGKIKNTETYNQYKIFCSDSWIQPKWKFKFYEDFEERAILREKKFIKKEERGRQINYILIKKEDE